MDTPAFLAAATALLKQAELSPRETAERFDAALDAGRWRRLVPFAPLGETRASHDEAQIAAGDASREKRRLDEDGYFRLAGVFDRSRIDRMQRIARAVRGDGWPAAFAFVFDDFWTIARTPPVIAFLEAALGSGFLQNTVVWAHWVPGAKGAAGWWPHDDYRGGGDSFLSLWIPLSDATVENGCMFLLPNALSREIAAAKETVPRALHRKALQGVVALPVPAGSMIGWRGDVLHWGGTNTGTNTGGTEKGGAPRASLALEFRSRDQKTTEFEWPLIDPGAALPPLSLRLFAIAKALREYPKFEPIMSRYRPLAERLFTELRPEG